MRRPLRVAIAGAGLVAAGVIAWLVVLANGGYNVAATAQHTALVYALLDHASQRSIEARARTVQVRMPPHAIARSRGLHLYRQHCEQCHGGPGVAPAPFALGLTPVPANLALTARERSPAVIYWTIRHGLKMTAMPAWEFRLSDDDLWAVTAFVGELASISPEGYAELVRGSAPVPDAPTLSAEAPTATPDAERGKIALQQHACSTCHEIPGIVGARHPVGPSLEGIASRRYLAGTLPNTRDNMVAWLRSPRSIAPGTAMPDLFVSSRDARDIAAFLATLR